VPTAHRGAKALPSFRCPHSDDQELGLNPEILGGFANTRQEPWKLPLPALIEALYFKLFY
jgi:hypothetical protein